MPESYSEMADAGETFLDSLFADKDPEDTFDYQINTSFWSNDVGRGGLFDSFLITNGDLHDLCGCWNP